MSRTHKKPTVLSLFSGAGGLDLGLEAAGFETRLCVEIDSTAQATLKRNRPAWRLAEPGDIHQQTPQSLLTNAGLRPKQLDLLAGGPPCQPFSKSGYWARGDAKRLNDPRSATLDAYLKIVEGSLPRVVLLENVRGLTYSGKDEGLDLLVRGFREINRTQGTDYALTVFHLNAAHYGVPQFRERVFVVADRNGRYLSMPQPTHGEAPELEPFLTSWDAIGDLDTAMPPSDLLPSGKWAALLPSVPEGENYLWHTPDGGGEPLFGWRTRYWSFLLKLSKARPSWTIQAEPGPATGPFHWKSRLLSTRELCRLQTFPDDYVIVGDRRSAHRQLGNAVPCALGELLGREIRSQFLGSGPFRGRLTLIPTRSPHTPGPEPVAPVPQSYSALRGQHRPHPGTGLGPRATARQSPALSAAVP